MHKLFNPYKTGDLRLSNRVVMAPMTRRRATEPFLVANDMIANYYVQRASAGLIIAEGSQISPQAFGYTGTPGCHTPEQIEGWRKVTERVHEAGGRIVLQLWHVGPFSHPLLQPDGKAPVAASVVCPQGEVLTPEGRLSYEPSRPITREEIKATIKNFGHAAKNALNAGFDGVEIHGAHAYLIDQFIMDGTNQRTDEYGGGIENRARFLFEVIEEVLKYAPPDKTGLRLSPKSVKPGMADSHPEQTYGTIMEKLNEYKLAFLHLSEMMTPEERLSEAVRSIVPYYREIYHGTLISCGGHSGESARRMLDQGHADLIAFGKPFISNPDLVRRLKKDLPLTEPDKETFYHGGPKGFVEYPEYSA